MQNASPPPATLFLLQHCWVPCLYRMQDLCTRIMPCMKNSHRRFRGIDRNFGVERSFSAAVNNSQENEQLLASTAEQSSASHGELNTRPSTECFPYAPCKSTRNQTKKTKGNVQKNVSTSCSAVSCHECTACTLHANALCHVYLHNRASVARYRSHFSANPTH